MFKTILLATDLGDQPRNARSTEAALRLLGDPEASLHVVTVVPDFGMSIVGSFFEEGHAKQALKEVRRQLSEWAAEAFPPEVTPQLHVVQGTIYDQILATANAIGADTIVIGAHRPEFRDYLIGPNAARVARHAVQSVVVVR